MKHKFIILPGGSRKTKKTFTNARENTDIWYYSGGMGRYTRAVTLPCIAAEAVKDRCSKTISIQVTNPQNKDVCYQYAEFRKSLNPHHGNAWNYERVRNEIYATIIHMVMWHKKCSLLNINLGLRNHFTILRIDLASKRAIITRENPDDPVILVENYTYMYKSYREECIQTMKQSKHVDFGKVTVEIDDLNKLDDNMTIKILQELNLFNNLTSQDIAEIVKVSKENESPF